MFSDCSVKLSFYSSTPNPSISCHLSIRHSIFLLRSLTTNLVFWLRLRGVSKAAWLLRTPTPLLSCYCTPALGPSLPPSFATRYRSPSSAALPAVEHCPEGFAVVDLSATLRAASLTYSLGNISLAVGTVGQLGGRADHEIRSLGSSCSRTAAPA